MKILILCPFSYPSACGVWTRVYEDARYLVSRGHEVHVFSSNIIKGTNERSSSYELFEDIHLHRFPVKFSIGENAKFWNFKKELMTLKPDIIHSHVLRHPHTYNASILAKKLRIPFIVTTHAPFVEKKLRGVITNLFVSFYDMFYAKSFFKRCSKVIAITHWEMPFLKQLGCPEEKIAYIPNGVSEDFFKIKKNIGKRPDKKQADIMFFGRIVPIKNIECLLRALKILKEYGIKFRLDIIGISQKDYLEKLKKQIAESGLEHEVVFKIQTRVNTLSEKIGFYKAHDILVLPSFREAMPFVLLEAMASGMTVVSSKTRGGCELVEEGKTGYLFEIDNEKDLAERIKQAIEKPINAKKEAKKYSLKILNPQLEKIYISLKN